MRVSLWMILGPALVLFGLILAIYGWFGAFLAGAGCALIVVSIVQVIWDGNGGEAG